MISLADLLRRFRRVWVPPGAALARVAPPVDVAARLRAEARPVLEAIEEMQQRAAAIRSAAEAKGAALVDAATQEAEEKVRQARADAPAARTAAVEQQWRAVEDDVSAALQSAQTEASRIEVESRARVADLVEKVRLCVLSAQDPTS